MGHEQARGVLRDHGVRPTRQREMVYAALASTDTHPTAEELLTAVRAADPGVSQATVYNTLETLTGCGLARRLPSRNAGGPCRFDADVHPHVHLTLPDGRVRFLTSESPRASGARGPPRPRSARRSTRRP